jgi:predicted nucleic-acid-binding protein
VIAVDTNILVRYITNDDPEQAARAAKLMAKDEIFIPRTVLLELEWVLRAGYGFAPVAIHGALQGVLGLSNVSVPDPLEIKDALAWYANGFDFADALHLASSSRADKFATFDVKLLKRARNLTQRPLVSP